MEIKIEKFTGPLDLLLDLIRREEMDILEIDIHKITEQNLNFLNQQKENLLDLDSAGEFIKMAALLMYIKSKSLFPSLEVETEEELEENAKALQQQLLKSLLKLQAAKKACLELKQRALLNKDVWGGGFTLEKALGDLKNDPISKSTIKQEPILKLMRAHNRVFQKKGKNVIPSVIGPSAPLPFLSDCIRSLHSYFVVGHVLKMSSLISAQKGSTLARTLVTFLSLLELSRLGIVSLDQEKEFSDIAISVKKQLNNKELNFIQEMSG